MPEKRIALVSFNKPWTGSLHTFTYGLHKLCASLAASPEFEDVEVEVIDLDTTDPEVYFDAIAAFRPTMIGFSLFVWSVVTVDALAKRLRAWDPAVRLVAGGPSARKAVMELEPYRDLAENLDAIAPGEGEQIIRELVRHHLEDDWTAKIPGLLVPRGGEWVSTGTRPRITLDEYPSPYQLGMVPKGVTGAIETFRGCPMSCTFCQWGTDRPDRFHSTEYLVRHLEGIKASDAPNVMFLDAGFNLHPRAFRNLMAAEAEVGALEHATVFGHLYPTLVRDEHLEFFSKIHRVQAAVGIQSFNPQVLRRLKRPFDMGRFDALLSVLRGHFEIDLEIIMGLPGDSPESFRETLHRAIELGDGIRVFVCMVLPDALMDQLTPENAIDFDPLTFYMRSCAGWSPDDIRREWEYVNSLSEGMRMREITEGMVGFKTDREDVPSVHGEGEGPISLGHLDADAQLVSVEVLERLRSAISEQTRGWSLGAMRPRPHGVWLELTAPTGPVVLKARPAEPGKRAFMERERVAYEHTGEVDPAGGTQLRQIVGIVHADAVAYVLGAAADEAPADAESGAGLVQLRTGPFD